MSGPVRSVLRQPSMDGYPTSSERRNSVRFADQAPPSTTQHQQPPPQHAYSIGISPPTLGQQLAPGQVAPMEFQPAQTQGLNMTPQSFALHLAQAAQSPTSPVVFHQTAPAPPPQVPTSHQMVFSYPQPATQAGPTFQHQASQAPPPQQQQQFVTAQPQPSQYQQMQFMPTSPLPMSPTASTSTIRVPDDPKWHKWVDLINQNWNQMAALDEQSRFELICRLSIVAAQRQ